MTTKKEVRGCWVKEKNGEITQHPSEVAIGMMARAEAFRMEVDLTHAEAVAVLNAKPERMQGILDGMRARSEPSRQEKRDK